MFRALQNASSKSLYVESKMLSSSIFKTVLKHSKSKFLEGLYIFFLGGPLKLPDFMIVDTNLWLSDKLLSKV